MNFLTFLSMIAFVGMADYVVGDCATMYSPCRCQNASVFGGLEVVCTNVPVATVKQVFGKLKNESITQLTLNVSSPINVSNITGNVNISVLALACTKYYAAPKWLNSALIVNQNAYGLTKLKIHTLFVWDCNLNSLNWGFLNGFTSLKHLWVGSCNNFPMTFHTLPSASLTSLSEILLNSLVDLHQFITANATYPVPPKNGLTTVYIGDIVYPNTRVDEIIQNFLSNWVTPSSKNTLISLHLWGNNMTKIPAEVAKYPNLLAAYIRNITQPWVLKNNSFYFTKNTTMNMRALSLSDSKLTSIEAGAFQGFLGNWFIDVSNNQLTEFSSDVFKPILQQLNATNLNGQVYAVNNPIDCVTKKCGLAWLIRDNRSLLRWVNAQCSNNGPYFSQLNSSSFLNC